MNGAKVDPDSIYSRMGVGGLRGVLLNQNAIMVSLISRNWLMNITYILCKRSSSLSVPCWSSSHPSTDQQQSGDKTAQTTFVDVMWDYFLLS